MTPGAAVATEVLYMRASSSHAREVSPLLGRDVELARLTECLEQARAGRGRLCVLVGEPGIGKTRLADELAARATGSARIVWGRCWEAGGAPAFWPWVQLLRGMMAAGDLEPAAKRMGSAAADVAAIVPEIADWVGPSRASHDASAETRFRLFDSVAMLLRSASMQTPLLMILDDVHVADVPSLLLLRFVARALSGSNILVVAAYRDVEARMTPEVGGILAEIERDAERITPRRLRSEEVDAFIEGVCGLRADARVTDAIARTTEGNPLFLNEAVRLAWAEGTLEAPTSAGLVRLSDGVGAAIRGRLKRLSAETRATLELAAVIGREFELKLLRAATSEPADVLLDRISEAVNLGVVVDLDVASPRFRFSHFLVREALYQDLGASARARLHASVAAGLERLHREAAEDHVAPLAHHFLLAGSAAPEGKAVSYAVRAGQRALRTFAYEEAGTWLGRALVAIEDAPAVDARRRADVLLSLAEAKTRAGDREGARHACLEAAAAARALGAPEILAQAALTLGAEFAAQMVDPTLVELLREAMDGLTEGSDLLRVRVMARLAAAMTPAPNPAEPLALAREAIALARRLGDRPTLARVLHAARAAYFPLDDLDERLSIDLEALELALETDQRALALQTHQRLVYEQIEVGDVARALVHADHYQQLASELRHPRHMFGALLARHALAGMAGRFEEAERLLASATELCNRTGDPTSPFSLLNARIGLARTAWRHDELPAIVDEIRSVMTFMVGHHRMLNFPVALAAVRLGDAASARAAFDIMAVETLPPTLGGQGLFAETCALLGDERRAIVLYARLLPWARRFQGYLGYEGSFSRPLGILATVLRRPDDAIAHFETALADNDRIGAHPWSATTAADLADVLETRGDTRRAAELRARARATAEDLGMPGLLARLGREERGAASVRAPAGAPAIDLSTVLRREGEVWCVSHGDVSFRLRDSRGLQMLSRLLEEPGRDVHVLDLASGPDEDGATSARSGDAGPMLDATAKAAYGRRLADLREALREAEEMSDRERAARCRREIQFLADEVSRAVGLGGRDRKAASDIERARVNVQRRLTDAIRKIAACCPELGDHFAKATTTGVYCCYRP